VLVVLTLPLTLVTLGFFLLIINALMVLLVAWLVPGFHVLGFWIGFWVALFMSVFSSFTNIVFHRNTFSVPS
jgi:putative membrane protein